VKVFLLSCLFVGVVWGVAFVILGLDVPKEGGE
jgi:hypothetical protein